MGTQICVRTLGSVGINVGKRRLGPSSGRPFDLLLYLASRRDHVASRRIVRELLFPRSENGKAAHSLRQQIYLLRKIGVALESDSDQLSLAGNDVTVDWWRIVDEGEIGPAELEQLSHGLFPGYTPTESDSFREWFEAERADIGRRLTRRLTMELVPLRAAGRWDMIDAVARALLALDPLSEEGTLARAQALAAGGSPNAALGLLEAYEAEVGEERPNLRLAPAALRRRIRERLPDAGSRSNDERAFVGRENMMRAMSAVVAHARAGIQEGLLVWGEPGIGKTRMLSEFRAVAALQGAATTMVSCQAHDVFRPLGTACDLAAQLLDAPGALGCDPVARALLNSLVNSNTQLESDREAANAELTLSAIVRSMDELISAIASESTVVVLIDDAQWLDPTSLQVILGVFGRRTRRPSCLILSSRERTALTGIDGHSDVVSSIRLNPLDSEAALELTRSLLRPNPNDEALRIVETQIREQARGNPFVIRVLCTHFAATRNSDSLNNTVSEILRRRVQQLATETRRTLEACVILATNCTFGRLEKLLDSPRRKLLQAIEQLDDWGLIEVSDGFIVSSHALLAEAVTEQMAPSIRKVLHTATAELLQHELEQPHSGRLPWDCAEHWRSAGNYAEAINVLRDCARRALDVGRPTDAAATIKHALTLESSDETRLELIQLALLGAWKSFEWQDVRELIDDLRNIRARVGSPSRVHDTSEILAFATVLHSEDDPSGNISALLECLTGGDTSDEHKVMAAWQLFLLADLSKDVELASFAFRAIAGRCSNFLDRRNADLVYHACFGDANEAIKLANELRATCTDISPRSVSFLLNVGYAYYRTGKAIESRQSLLRAFEGARSIKLPNIETHAALFLAQLCWSTEEYDDSRIWHGILRDLLANHHHPGVMWEYHLLAARLAIHDGNLTLAQSNIDLSRKSPQSRMEWPRMQILSCEADLRCKSKEAAPFSDEELESLWALHRRAQACGGQDEIVLALARALLQRDRVVDALAIVDSYQSVRREKTPLRRSLADLRAKLHQLTTRGSRSQGGLHNY